MHMLIEAPVGLVKQWTARDPETEEPTSTFPWAKGELPPGEAMPGTQQSKGKEVVHITFDGTVEELEATLLAPMTVLAAQEHKLTYDYTYDEEGNLVGMDGPYGVAVAVPPGFTKYLPDIVEYDEDGNEVARKRPEYGSPLHTFGGQDPWVWSPVEAAEAL
jgi:hypothetical protein